MLADRVKMASITMKSYTVFLEPHPSYDAYYYDTDGSVPLGIMYAINGGEWEPLTEVPTTLVDVYTIKFKAWGFDFWDWGYQFVGYVVISTTRNGSDIAYTSSELITETIDITKDSVFYCGANY